MVDRRIANSGQVRGLSSSLESTGWKALSKRKLCLVIFILLPLLNIVQTRIYSREQAHHVPAAKSPRHHDLLSLREILHLLEKHEKEIHEKHRASRDSVTVVLNVFLRPGAFRRVLDGIGSQTALQSITHVNVLALGSPFVHQYGKLLEEYRKTASWTSEVSISLVTSEPTFNPGYFGRFLLSMNLNTTFTLILDDDVVLGARYLELCLRWARSIDKHAVLGQRGARYYRNELRKRSLFGLGKRLSPNKYHDFFGEHGLLRDTDVLFSAWFLRTKWILKMFAEEPLTWATAEDIHLGMLLRQRFGIRMVALPVDPQLPEFRLNHDQSLEITNRSWSDENTALVRLRDAAVDMWLSRELHGQLLNPLLYSWTRKDVFWYSMPVKRGAGALSAYSSSQRKNRSGRLHVLWRPFACKRLRFAPNDSVPMISLPYCRRLRYRRPRIGIAKSYFGLWNSGYLADCLFWGDRNGASYHEFLGYTLDIRGQDEWILDGILYGNTYGRVRLWDVRRNALIIDEYLEQNVTLRLKRVTVVPPTTIIALFSERLDDGVRAAQRKLFDEIRILPKDGT